MNKNFIWLFALLFCVTCNQNPFKEEHRIPEFFPREISLEGEALVIDAPGIVNLFIADTILLARLFNNPEALMSAFSLNGLIPLGPIIKQGKGPEEFLSVTSPNQFQVDTSGVKMWGHDYHRSDFYFMNVSKTIKQQHPVIEKRFRVSKLPPLTNLIYVNDSLLWCISTTIDNLELISYDINNQSVLYREPLLEPSPILSRYSHALSHITAVKPDVSKMVVALLYLNQVQIISLDNPPSRVNFSCSGKAVNFDHVSDNMIDLVQYYKSIRVTDQFIFAFYSGLPFNEHADAATALIHVFDWNGDPKALLKLPHNTSYFAIDEKNGCLYGLSSDGETIYKYDISELLNE